MTYSNRVKRGEQADWVAQWLEEWHIYLGSTPKGTLSDNPAVSERGEGRGYHFIKGSTLFKD